MKFYRLSSPPFEYQPKTSSVEGNARFTGSMISSLFLMLFSLLIIPSLLFAQNFSQTIERSAQFENPNDNQNELRVYNIHGNVTVEGYDGDEIQITARQQIDGTYSEIEQGRQELEFVVDQKDNRVYVYLDAPFIRFKQDGYDFNYHINRRNNTYDFVHHITVRVPRNTHLYASTINRGTVEVQNVARSISASNVNGKIKLHNIAGPTHARTVNGDINILYANAPVEDSDYKTVNGTIEVNYPAGLSADIQFKSLHGELFTDFEDIKRLKSRAKTNRAKQGNAIRYQVDKFSPIRIGNGGPTFQFEVLNGNVYIKRIQS